MSAYRIRIALDNAAFSEESGAEVARILREIANEVDGRDILPGERQNLFDANGNRVGLCWVR